MARTGCIYFSQYIILYWCCHWWEDTIDTSTMYHQPSRHFLLVWSFWLMFSFFFYVWLLLYKAAITLSCYTVVHLSSIRACRQHLPMYYWPLFAVIIAGHDTALCHIYAKKAITCPVLEVKGAAKMPSFLPPTAPPARPLTSRDGIFVSLRSPDIFASRYIAKRIRISTDADCLLQPIIENHDRFTEI